MGEKKQHARRDERRRLKIARTIRSMTGNLVFVFLAGAVVLFAVVVIAAARNIPSNTTSANESNVAATRIAATASAGSGWIQLSADTPAAVIAAARNTTLFKMDRSGNGDDSKTSPTWRLRCSCSLYTRRAVS